MHIRRRPELGLASNRQTQRGRKAMLLLEWLEERCTPSGEPFMGPPLIQSVNGILSTTLTEAVGPAVVGDTQVQNAWVYNGSYPGPALVANPGDSLDIKIVMRWTSRPTSILTACTSRRSATRTMSCCKLNPATRILTTSRSPPTTRKACTGITRTITVS
jgi:hypothetical protein